MDWARWQALWDAQQQLHLPDREERFAAMLDVFEATVGGTCAPRVVDLAGGTGSITRRVLERFPTASSTVVDVDPALLAIAAGTFDGDARVGVHRADLATPTWVDGLVAGSFDAVLTATALHWLPADRVAGVYAEAFSLLRSGGVLVNADHMPDSALGGLGDKLRARWHDLRAGDLRAGEQPPVGGGSAAGEGERAASAGEATATAVPALDWEEWWALLAEEPGMSELVAERNRHFSDRAGSAHAQSDLDEASHRRALLAAGFARMGIVWRHFGDAVLVAQRD